MVEAVSLGIAVLAVIIAMIAIILTFVQEIQRPQGIPIISGWMEGLNYSGFKTVSNIQFIIFRKQHLLGPLDSLNAGDSI